MSSMSVKAPKEDPQVAAARAAETARADAAFVTAEQGNLSDELRKRNRRLGARQAIVTAGINNRSAAGLAALSQPQFSPGSGSQGQPYIDYGSLGEGFRQPGIGLY